MYVFYMSSEIRIGEMYVLKDIEFDIDYMRAATVIGIGMYYGTF
jgi:hypothetical protein